MWSRALVPVLALAVLASPAVAHAALRPSVSRLTLSPATFSAGTQKQTSFRFTLSRRATVRISIARERAGRRPLVVGGLVRRAGSGRVAIGWSGRLNRRALAPAKYRATLVATDSRHRRSRARIARFTIVAAPAAAPPTGAPAPSPSPGPAGFPSPATTGVPAGWTPAETRSTDIVVRQAGAVIQDVRLLNADIDVQAPNVTIRRVDLQGGTISNFVGNPCQNGMVVEDTTIEPAPGQNDATDTEGVIASGGYTARRVKIWRRAEGFRSEGDCGPVRIEDSFAKIVIPQGRCDLHSDGIQGYGGPWTTVVNTTIDFNEATCGTAPFFIPKNQGNTGATVDRLLVMGGGYPFRLGVPATVSGLKIVNNSWVFGPIDVACSLVTSWDAAIVTMTPDYQVASTVRAQRCNTEGGT